LMIAMPDFSEQGSGQSYHRSVSRRSAE
jgi:hypothetical protein